MSFDFDRLIHFEDKREVFEEYYDIIVNVANNFFCLRQFKIKKPLFTDYR